MSHIIRTLLAVTFFILVASQNFVEDPLQKTSNPQPYIQPTRETFATKPEEKTNCATKCMDKIRHFKVKKCKQVYQEGPSQYTCSTQKINHHCDHLCLSGQDTCTQACPNGINGGICQNRCFKENERCKSTCTWENHKECIMKRLPGKFNKECNFVLVSKVFRTCLKDCVKEVPHKSCANQCTNIQVPHKFKICIKTLQTPEKNEQKCSVKKGEKKCNKHCHKGNEECHKDCHSNYRGQNLCRWKCVKSHKSCKTECVWGDQLKCYMKRTPEKHTQLCHDALKYKNVEKCLKKCVYSYINVPFQVKTKPEEISLE